MLPIKIIIYTVKKTCRAILDIFSPLRGKNQSIIVNNRYVFFVLIVLISGKGNVIILYSSVAKGDLGTIVTQNYKVLTNNVSWLRKKKL